MFDYQSLESMLALERAGVNPNGEGTLKEIIRMNILTRQNSVLFGFEVSPQLRREWQLRGIDPDSANEVAEYLSQNHLDDTIPYFRKK